jgi:hypothetical protein
MVSRGLLSVIVTGMGGACIGCTSMVNSVAFQPSDDGVHSMPGGGPHVIEKRFPAADGVALHAYYLPNDTSDRVVIFFHGNYGNSTQRLSHAASLHDLGVAVLLLSYRGYPKSGGSASEQGVYLDAQAALGFVDEDLGYAKPSTFILGRSLGSAVAVDVAQEQPLAGLILISPISSGADFAEYHGLGWAKWLVGDPFDSLEKLERVSSPILIIHGNEDRTLPIEMGRALHAAAPPGSTLIEVPGAGHNDLVSRAGRCYWIWISRFIHGANAIDDTQCAE